MININFCLNLYYYILYKVNIWMIIIKYKKYDPHNIFTTSTYTVGIIPANYYNLLIIAMPYGI